MIGLMFFLMLLFVGCSQGTDKRLVPAWDDGKWGYINAEASVQSSVGISWAQKYNYFVKKQERCLQI